MGLLRDTVQVSDLVHSEPEPDPGQTSRMTNLRTRELFAQFDATTEPCDGNAPSRELAESGRQEVFREFLWRMHNHPSQSATGAATG